MYNFSRRARKWLCKSDYSLMGNGKSSSRCYPHANARDVAVRPKPIARSLKASCGFSKPAPAGATCRPTLGSVPACVGSAFGFGRSKGSGSGCGAPFWPSWTSAASSTGRRAFWMAALRRLKRGRCRRQNQARQGHEVDGGGRRPRCSFGKPPGPSLASRSDLGEKNPPTNKSSARWPGPAQESSATIDRRSRLRQRPVAGVAGRPGHRIDLPTPLQPHQASDAGRTKTAALSPTLEGRADFCLAGQLPTSGGTLRAPCADVPRLLSCCLCLDHLAFPPQMNFETTSNQFSNVQIPNDENEPFVSFVRFRPVSIGCGKERGRGRLGYGKQSFANRNFTRVISNCSFGHGR